MNTLVQRSALEAQQGRGDVPQLVDNVLQVSRGVSNPHRDVVSPCPDSIWLDGNLQVRSELVAYDDVCRVLVGVVAALQFIHLLVPAIRERMLADNEATHLPGI